MAPPPSGDMYVQNTGNPGPLAKLYKVLTDWMTIDGSELSKRSVRIVLFNLYSPKFKRETISWTKSFEYSRKNSSTGQAAFFKLFLKSCYRLSNSSFWSFLGFFFLHLLLLCTIFWMLLRSTSFFPFKLPFSNTHILTPFSRFHSLFLLLFSPSSAIRMDKLWRGKERRKNKTGPKPTF